jgi:hypothetical protein
VNNAFINFFITITEKYRNEKGKGDGLSSTRLISWETPKHKNNPSSNNRIVLVGTQRWYLYTKIRATSFGTVVPSSYPP